MNILLWIVFGALAGWVASMIMNTGSSLVWDTLMGVIGAVVGGFLFSLLGMPGVTGFDLYSIVVAIVGAMVVIYIGRLIRHQT